MIEVEIPHSHSPAEAAQRVRAAAERLDVLPVDQEELGSHGGTMRKDTPLGSVVARWTAHEAHVTVTILQKPAFLPESTVRRLLLEGLAQALA